MDLFSSMPIGLAFRGAILVAAFAALSLRYTAVATDAFTGDIRRDAVVAAVEKVMPCVANIATRTVVRSPVPSAGLRGPFYQNLQPGSIINLGSGVVIDEEG